MYQISGSYQVGGRRKRRTEKNKNKNLWLKRTVKKKVAPLSLNHGLLLNPSHNQQIIPAFRIPILFTLKVAPLSL
jgi:hypothetical protein